MADYFEQVLDRAVQARDRDQIPGSREIVCRKMVLDGLCSKMQEHLLYTDTSSHSIMVDICQMYSNLVEQ